MNREDPRIFTLRTAFEPDDFVKVFGTQGLMEVAPKLRPDLYHVSLDGVAWGTILVSGNGRWEIEGEGFSAAPGYIVV